MALSQIESIPAEPLSEMSILASKDGGPARKASAENAAWRCARRCTWTSDLLVEDCPRVGPMEVASDGARLLNLIDLLQPLLERTPPSLLQPAFLQPSARVSTYWHIINAIFASFSPSLAVRNRLDYGVPIVRHVGDIWEQTNEIVDTTITVHTNQPACILAHCLLE